MLAVTKALKSKHWITHSSKMASKMVPNQTIHNTTSKCMVINNNLLVELAVHLSVTWNSKKASKLMKTDVFKEDK